MKCTPFDIVSIFVILATGLTTLGLGLILLEELELNYLAIWAYVVSCSIFALHYALVSNIVNKIHGKRTKLGKEIDELRERVDALERGVKE